MLLLNIRCLHNTQLFIEFVEFTKVPLNNKETMLQRQISLDREDTETGLEALEEPLKAKKRRESRQGINRNWQSQSCYLV